MKIIYRILLLHKAFVIVCVHGIDLCPDGSYVLGRGLTPEDQQAATDEHNRFRKMLTDGVVDGQPQAQYMKTMIYDDILADKCVSISDQCWMNHLPVEDERWHCVGQNIYIQWHSQFTPYQNWTAALASWFYECYDFQYPNIHLTGREVGHYTQVAWADSYVLGCDYISFIDKKKPWTPFCSMYTCNYGPCGNYNKQAPYRLVNDTTESCTSSESSDSSSSSTSETSESSTSSKSSKSSSESHETVCSNEHHTHYSHESHHSTHTSHTSHTSSDNTPNQPITPTVPSQNGGFIQNILAGIFGRH